MQLLLLLSAMLAGLTGLISGDRAVEARQVERSAFSASTDAAAATEAAEAAARILVHRAPAAPTRLGATPRPTLAALEAPQSAPVDERRLE